MSAHTPGPWYVDGPYFGRYDIYSRHTVNGKECLSGKQSIAICHHTSKKQTPVYAEMFEANARLIAAAPELLAALKELEESTDWTWDNRARVKARAAIAKAQSPASGAAA